MTPEAEEYILVSFCPDKIRNLEISTDYFNFISLKKGGLTLSNLAS